VQWEVVGRSTTPSDYVARSSSVPSTFEVTIVVGAVALLGALSSPLPVRRADHVARPDFSRRSRRAWTAPQAARAGLQAAPRACRLEGGSGGSDSAASGERRCAGKIACK
jgi:hypothetical protein